MKYNIFNKTFKNVYFPFKLYLEINGLFMWNDLSQFILNKSEKAQYFP